MIQDDWVPTCVAARVRQHLSTAYLPDAYLCVLTAALAQRGNVLSSSPDFRWARPAVVCCVAAGGAADQTLPVAAAAETAMVALDLLDDLEDGESNPLVAEFGVPVTLNATTGLMYLAHSILLDAAGGAALALCWLDAGLRAGGGQHADITHTAAMGLSYDDLLRITSAKSGSLMAGVCRLGALAAGTDFQRLHLFADFGRFLGVAAQVANDIRGVGSCGEDKTDALLNRPTLPLAFAARTQSVEPCMQPLRDTGALHFAWAVAETYRRHALRLIPLLTDDTTSRESLTRLLKVL